MPVYGEEVAAGERPGCDIRDADSIETMLDKAQEGGAPTGLLNHSAGDLVSRTGDRMRWQGDTLQYDRTGLCSDRGDEGAAQTWRAWRAPRATLAQIRWSGAAGCPSSPTSQSISVIRARPT